MALYKYEFVFAQTQFKMLHTGCDQVRPVFYFLFKGLPAELEN